MPTPPRIARFDQSIVTRWSDGSLFNGYLLVGVALPTLSGTAFQAVHLGNGIGSAEPVSQFTKIPIREGKYDFNSGLFYNADLTPPGSIYVCWLYTSNGQGKLRQVSASINSFSVVSPTVTLALPSPTVPTTGSVPNPDVSPSVPTSQVQMLLTFAVPQELPDGVITTFTFGSVPQAITYNGLFLIPNTGYTRLGNTITLVDSNGLPFAPETGASIRAIL